MNILAGMKALLALFVVAFLLVLLSQGNAPKLSDEPVPQFNFTPSVNVTQDLSIEGVRYSAEGFVNRTLPDSASVCLYGERKAWLADDFFGSVDVLGKTVALSPVWLNSTAAPASFVDCAVVVLFDDSDGRFMERSQRLGVAEALHRGAGLVVEKRGGSLMKSDAAVAGFSPVLDAFVPVKITGEGADGEFLGEVLFTGVLGSPDSSMLFAGVGEKNVTGLRVTMVQQVAGRTAAWLRDASGLPTRAAYPAAVVVDSAVDRNLVVYFAYPVEETPVALRNSAREAAVNYVGRLAFLRIAG